MQFPLGRKYPLWKPPGRLRVNPHHPLANGLVYASGFNEGVGVPRNLASAYPDAPSKTGSANWLASAYGEGLNFPATGSSSNYIDTGTQLGMNGTAQCSVFVFCQITAINGGVEGPLLFLGDNSSYGWVFRWYCIDGTNASLNFALNNIISFTNSSSFKVAQNSGGATPTLNAILTCGFSFLGNNASGLNYYAYGANKGTVSTTGHSSALTGARGLAIGGAGTSFPGLGDTKFAVYVWNNIQPAETFARLNADPYQLFEPDWAMRPSVQWLVGAATPPPATSRAGNLPMMGVG